MDSSHQINVPLRSGGKKMRKRRELDALIVHSLAKRGNGRRLNANGGAHSQDKLLSASTDDPEEYVWPKVTHSAGRGRKRKYVLLRMCKPFLFVAGAGLLVGFMYWFYLDLRQQIYEYRQKIEEVSATSQNLPDTLQKWHETSSFLLKNQSTLLQRTVDLQRTVETLRNNFTEYRALVDAQHNYAKEEKLVADFGAKIEAVATDIDSIKEHYNVVVSTQTLFEKDLLKLKSNITDIQSVASGAMELPSQYSNEMKEFKSSLMANLKNLEYNFSVINDTLSQKSEMLHEELVVHKSKLDELFDRFENITSHVTSIENSWPEFRQKIVDYDKNGNRLKNEITKLKSKIQQMENTLQNLCTTCTSQYAEALREAAQKRVDHSQSTLQPGHAADVVTTKVVEFTNAEVGSTAAP